MLKFWSTATWDIYIWYDLFRHWKFGSRISTQKRKVRGNRLDCKSFNINAVTPLLLKGRRTTHLQTRYVLSVSAVSFLQKVDKQKYITWSRQEKKSKVIYSVVHHWRVWLLRVISTDYNQTQAPINLKNGQHIYKIYCSLPKKKRNLTFGYELITWPEIHHLEDLFTRSNWLHQIR